MAIVQGPRRSPARLLVFILPLLTVIGSASAHNGEPRPGLPNRPIVKSPTDLRNVTVPPRWSWLHWWEANRDRFLVAPSQDDAMQAAEAQRLDALRNEASRELIKAIESNGHTALTIESVLALGKMRHEPALPAMVTLASRGDRGDIRRAAVLSIGLLGSGAAEKQLIEFNASRLEDRVTAIAGLGMLPAMDKTTLRQLRRMVTVDGAKEAADKVGTSSVIAWSLRHHRVDDNLQYFRNLLRTSVSPWVASEALLGVGATRDRSAQPLLEATLFGKSTPDVKAYENLEELRKAKFRQLGPAAAEPVRDESKDRDRDAEEGRVLEAGPELIAMGWLRSSAAIALGELGAPRAANPLLVFLDEDPVRQPYLVTPMGFAIMSLTAYPSDATCDRFLGLLGKQDGDGRPKLTVAKDSPLRGFAALALGLYAKQYATEQGPADRPGYDVAITTLSQRLEDDREEEEVRTACAVALGLTQRTGVLPVLHRAATKFEQRNRRNEQSIWGFVMLGRALAGDRNVIEPASKVLIEREDDVTPTGILSRRATVLALGVTRSADAIPVLTKAWHLNHYVNREVILSLRLVGGGNAAAPVMQRLREAKDQEERAYMAQALGELLAHDRPTALSRLTAESNYTVRNEHLLPLQSLANGFLFDYLIASFGEDW
ncbi:MAG: hypothetical protein WBD40_12190 [Tepidisphaeraceae bacterium]